MQPDTSVEITSDDELAGLSEFALLRENARSAGVTGSLPPVARVSVPTEHGAVSALRWGEGEPQIVFLHGGGQNAHTWDTVVLATGLPALTVDLPGHGRSDWRADRDYMPWANAETLTPVLEQLAPRARLVVGMSLGGLTALRLTAVAPHLTPRLLMVDVTPGVAGRQRTLTTAERGTTALVGSRREFDTFDEMLEHSAAAAPDRDREVLRRGVLHNSRRLPDGRWTWRYDQLTGADFQSLWADVDQLGIPTTLVRGGASAFVGDEDVAEFRRRHPAVDVHLVERAGHSVQTDAPRELARLILRAVEA